MANYKVVFRADLEDNRSLLTWEPGCPALVEVVQVSRNTDTSETYLQIKVQNVCNKIVDEITVEATVVYKTEPEQKIRIQELDCSLRPGASQALKPVKLAYGDVSEASVAILSVAGESIEWETVGETEPVPEPAELPISETAMAERVRLLKEKDIPTKAAKKLPVATDEWWVCGCGQITVGNRKCLACGSDLEDLLGLQDEEQLLDSTYKRAVELQTKDMVDSLKSAKKAFESLGGYRDSFQRAIECAERINALIYEKAVADRAEHTEKSLAEAIEAFESVGSYRDSAKLAATSRTELNALKNENLIKKKKGIKKIAIIGTAAAVVIIGITLWITVIGPMTSYSQAMTLLNQGEYKEAQRAFSDLGNYKDSKSLSEELTNISLAGDDFVEAFQIINRGEGKVVVKCAYPTLLMRSGAKIDIEYTEESESHQTITHQFTYVLTDVDAGKTTLTIELDAGWIKSAEVTGYTPA
jgi:tetratricopeptide (TPR) repeat protein